jgi:phosphoglycolate phosphatase
MIEKYDVILFDLDGTLADPYEGITRAIEFGMNGVGLPPEPRERLARFIGTTLWQEAPHQYGLDRATTKRMIDLFTQYYEERGWRENHLFPGAAELLDRLRAHGRRLALATLKPRPHMERVLRHLDLERRFDAVASSDGELRAPDQKTVIMSDALAALDGADPARAVMVGDRRFDILGACACGIDSIAVTWGYAEPGEIAAAAPTHIVQDFNQLSELLI